jgi:hypothetical protein
MSIEKLELLRQPFPANQISYLPKGGVQLAYVGHAALTDRLLNVDPGWNWEPLALSSTGLPQFDESGGLWIRLTICGVTRLGYGNAKEKANMEVGSREKECIGDALRNAAMRFGAALDLWHKGELHAEELPVPILALQKQLEAAGIPAARFCKAANIESLKDLPLENMKMAQEWIAKAVQKKSQVREPGADESEDVKQ